MLLTRNKVAKEVLRANAAADVTDFQEAVLVCSLHAASQVGDVGCAKAVSSLDGRCFRQTDFKVGLDAARFLRLGHRDHEAEMVALKFSFAACAAGNLLRDCIAAGWDTGSRSNWFFHFRSQ